MYPDLEGKVAVVTGAAGGIGGEIARLFAREGVFVCLADKVRADTVASEILAAGGSCRVDEVDVTREDSITAYVAAITSAQGRIDILVNNAGVLRPSLVEETSLEAWNFMLSINLTSVFMFSKAILPVMKRTGGCILNAASWAAKIPSIGHGGYGAAKAGVVNLTATMAGELAQFGIRVIAYMPGVVKTGLSAGIVEKNPQGVANSIALGRIADPVEIAKVIVFLASGQAAYIDGSTVEISGGKLCVQNPIPLQNEV
jgi:NAD(P)-dependent dehydrogenase (short-subunit alcohol dehydrogenase family)